MMRRVANQRAPRTPGGSTRCSLPTNVERVLLFNPPVHDTRLPWSKWQQPVQLLKLSTYFKSVGADVRMVDALFCAPKQRLRRERAAFLPLDGLNVPKWRYGSSSADLGAQLRALNEANWRPDVIYVECSTTFWWEGANEAIAAAKVVFPTVPVTLIGTYVSLAGDHAREHTAADGMLTKSVSAVASLAADTTLYPVPPSFHCLSLGAGARGAEDVIAEIEQARSRNIRNFAFMEHAVVNKYPTLYRSILELLAVRRVGAKFHLLGSITPSDFVADPELAHLMKRAGYVQICFADDREVCPTDLGAEDRLIEEYRLAAQTCRIAGFKDRTGEVMGSVSIGRSGEDFSRRARLATHISHFAGSIILWPYQPSREECPGVPLEMQNGRLFPLRHMNGHTYRDYLNLMGLAVVLNSKYRAQSFDFLGESMMARLFRESLGRKSWDAPEDVKGSIRLPMVARS